MRDSVLKRAIRRWVLKIGPRQAQMALVVAGVGVSTAEKLAAGRYISEPKGEIALAIERVLIEQGVLNKDKAS